MLRFENQLREQNLVFAFVDLRKRDALIPDIWRGYFPPRCGFVLAIYQKSAHGEHGGNFCVCILCLYFNFGGIGLSLGLFL